MMSEAQQPGDSHDDNQISGGVPAKSQDGFWSWMRSIWPFFNKGFDVLKNQPILAALWGLDVLFLIALIVSLVLARLEPIMQFGGLVLVLLLSALLFAYTVHRMTRTSAPGESPTPRIPVNTHHKRDFLAFISKLFSSTIRAANDHFVIYYFSEDVKKRYQDEQRQSLGDALFIAEHLGSIDASYTIAVSQMRQDWHRFDPVYKQELIKYLKNSPVGSEFEGMLFLTSQEEEHLRVADGKGA